MARAAVFAGEVVDIADVDLRTNAFVRSAGASGSKCSKPSPVSRPDEIVVYTNLDSAACGFPFSRGDRYLVFAHRAANGPLTVSICSSTKPLSRFNGDYKYLRSLKTTAPPFGRLRGRATSIEERSGFFGRRTRPFDGARIIASGGGYIVEVVTDRDGKFEIVAPAGRYNVEVRVPGGLSARILTPDVWILDPKSCGEAEVIVRPIAKVSAAQLATPRVCLRVLRELRGDASWQMSLTCRRSIRLSDTARGRARRFAQRARESRARRA